MDLPLYDSYKSSLLPRLRPPPKSTLFPYTTLFRSRPHADGLDQRLLHLPPALLVGDLAHHELVALGGLRSEEHTSELQSRLHLVCRLLLEKKNTANTSTRNQA